MLSTFNIIELSTAVATILGACGMLLAVTQKSKCKNLKLCWGCVVCDRVVDLQDIEEQNENENENDDEPDIEDEKKDDFKNEVKLPKVNILVKK